VSSRPGIDFVPVVDVKDLAFTYEDGRRALHDVSFTAGEGERVAILGPNGAGKSTLLMLLAGLIRAASGHATVNGTRLDSRRKPGYVRGVGILFQDPDDQIFMPTVEEDVAFGPINLGLEREVVEMRVDMALRLTGLEDLRERVPHHLSFGEKKRVALAGVLAMEPEVLLLDEPTANLDPRGRGELVEFLRNLKCTILVATHDLFSALEMTERAIVLKGTILGSGEYRDLFADEDVMERASLRLPDLETLVQKVTK